METQPTPAQPADGAAVLDLLRPHREDDGRYRLDHLPGAGPVIFGGQLLAQMVLGLADAHPERLLRSLDVQFLRATCPDGPAELRVETVHAGRTVVATRITVQQGGRVCVVGQAMLHTPDVDLVRHQAPAPAGRPPTGPGKAGHMPWWTMEVVDGVDLSDPTVVGPPRLAVWCRMPGSPAEPVVGWAMAAFASDGFLIATAMRPHEGLGQSLAHRTVDTTVLRHSLTFTGPLRADEWFLLEMVSEHAGSGRCHGRGQVFTASGDLAATFSQDAVLRRMT